MIFIRTDSNAKIATGHMMRCLTIAKELRTLGETVTFLVSDCESEKLLFDEDFNYEVLDTKWDDLNTDDEISKMKAILEEAINPVLFVDSYFASNEYYVALKPYAKIACFDDFFDEKYDVDLLINYSIFHDMYDYESRYAASETKCLIGPEYVPLRRQFVEEKKTRAFTKDSLDILVMCGGGDIHNVLAGLCEYGIREGLISDETVGFQNVFHIIVGAYNPNIERLRELASKYPQIKLYENVSNIASMMAECDVLVSAASTVLYEACAMGIPTVFFCMADDQVNDAKYFVRDASFLYAGDVRENKSKCLANVFSSISDLKENPTFIRQISKKSRALVDGLGAKKIAEEIINL